jgi:hypothetical protein
MIIATEYRAYLSRRTFDYLRECCLAYSEKQHLASAIWAAVFLEAFLGELAEKLAIGKPNQDDLNGRIQQLRQYSKNHNPQKPDVPDDIVNRCHDIRGTRNRLVHDMGLAKQTLNQDADFILAGLKVILDWYLEICGDSRSDEEGVDISEQHASLIPVFISTITPHTQRQEYFLEILMSRLREIGFQPKRLVTTIFDKNDPIAKVRKSIEACRGAIIVGLERSHAYFLRDKEGTEKQLEETHRKYTSGWLHLEAGIANALGLPVFVICEKDICGDGIFDREWNTYPVTELASLDEDSTELKTFLEHVAQWAREELTKSSS